jgi:ketosteroid isomerase-like protein
VAIAMDSGSAQRNTRPVSSYNAELVRDGFDAFLRGDFEALHDLLHPKAQWLSNETSVGACEDREMILATLRERHQEGVVTELHEVTDGGEQVLIEVFGPQLAEWGLPDGRASMVVTVLDGRIVRMQDYPSLADARAGAALAPTPRPAPPARRTDAQPGWDRVSDLVPMAHAGDIEASIAFYAHLGFQPTATYVVRGRTEWASLQAGEARLMLARADEPVVGRQQAVLFYLYARDLFGLRESLVREGIEPGPIRDGSPGPKAEMRVEDPDGYVLIIAQIEDELPADVV